MSLTFGVFADLHVSIMHDPENRLKAFLDDAQQKKVDFIVHLGDFCSPNDIKLSHKNKGTKSYIDSENIIKAFREFPIPHYSVIGNHDLDFCNKEEMANFFGMPNAYYSYDCKDYHFVCLDANFFKKDGEYHDYANSNYYPHDLPYLPESQMEWLRDDLKSTTKKTILFSHQSLTKEPFGIKNFEQFHKIVDEINANEQKIILALNGHSHLDNIATHNKVHYLNINSMSNQWLGDDYETVRYSSEITAAFPHLKYTVPYKDPLYAFITVSDNQIIVEGKDSTFVGIQPSEQGYTDEISSSIESRILHY